MVGGIEPEREEPEVDEDIEAEVARRFRQFDTEGMSWADIMDLEEQIRAQVLSERGH